MTPRIEVQDPYGMWAVVVFEERSTHEPHAWGDHQGLARSHGAEGLA